MVAEVLIVDLTPPVLRLLNSQLPNGDIFFAPKILLFYSSSLKKMYTQFFVTKFFQYISKNFTQNIVFLPHYFIFYTIFFLFFAPFLFSIFCHNKNQTFGQKPSFWSNNKPLVKNLTFGQNQTFGQKPIFWSKTNLWSKTKLLVKTNLLVKNRTFDQKTNFCSQIKLLVKNQTFRQK